MRKRWKEEGQKEIDQGEEVDEQVEKTRILRRRRGGSMHGSKMT